MNNLTPPTSASSPAARPDAATYRTLFNDEQTRCAPGALVANNSRLAYLVYLKELIAAFEVHADVSAPITLVARRPDLLALKLDERSARKVLPKLRRVLSLLESRAQEALTAKQSLQQVVAENAYQADVPFHHAWESVKKALATKGLHLWDLLNAAQSGYPSFAFDNLALATQRAAITLCSGFSAQLQKMLLKGESGLALADIDSTRKLAKALGVTRRQLRQLLAVHAVGENGSSVTRSSNVPLATAASSKVHGAAFINNAQTPLYLSESATLPPAKQTVLITGLTQAHLERLSRVLRLQRALNLSAGETDALVMAALRAEGQTQDYHLTANTLRALGLFRHLQGKYKVSPWQYAALIDQICPYTTGRQVAFYDKLFAPSSDDDSTPAVPALGLDDSEFDHLATSGADALTLKQLALGLKVDPALLRVVLSWVIDAQSLSKAKRSLAVVSACYRVIAVCRLFGTSIRDGMLVLELLTQEQPAYCKQLAGIPSLKGETGKPDIVDVIAGMAQVMEWLQRQGLEAEALAMLVSQNVPYVLQGWESAFKAQPFDTQNLDGLYHALSQALGLEDGQLAAPLLRWANVDPNALAARIAAIVKACPPGSPPLGQFTAHDQQQWWTLQRHAHAVKQFKLGSEALWQICLNPHWFDLKGKKKANGRPLDITTVYQLTRYQALLHQLPEGQRESDLLNYLSDFDSEVNGPVDGDQDKVAWSVLERLLGRPAGTLATLPNLLPPTSLRGIDQLLRLLVVADSHNLALDTLLDLSKLPQAQAKDYALFQQAAIGVRKACSFQQRKVLDEQLSVAWRDALLRWMLVQWVPKDPARSWITSPQALADYLLIDLQVSHEPRTTPILSATASLQRYLHQIHSRLENGYRSTAISDAQRDEWESFSSNYERWKLRQDARNEPQNFIDPTRRQRKTTAFKDLETLLAQGKCTADEIQTAMLGYLSAFETVSNIQPISAYADGTSPLCDTYHFIGKTNVEPVEYYWRTLDMSQRAPDGAPSMLAWGEWEKITLTLGGAMVETPLPEAAVNASPAQKALLADDLRTHLELVRPVMIAGRRYVVWVERDNTAIPMGKDNKPSDYYPFRVCFAFQQTDGGWSPANKLMALSGHDEAGVFDPTPPTFKSGAIQGNLYLKTKDFQPVLMVMVNSNGDRQDDPWLTVVLLDSSVCDAADFVPKRNHNYFIVTKDLLLLENKLLDTEHTVERPLETQLVSNWLRFFRDPRVVQHPYVGAVVALEQKSSGSTPFSWNDNATLAKLQEQYEVASRGDIKANARLTADASKIEITVDLEGSWKTRNSGWVMDEIVVGSADNKTLFHIKGRANEPTREDFETHCHNMYEILEAREEDVSSFSSTDTQTLEHFSKLFYSVKFETSFTDAGDIKIYDKGISVQLSSKKEVMYNYDTLGHYYPHSNLMPIPVIIAGIDTFFILKANTSLTFSCWITYDIKASAKDVSHIVTAELNHRKSVEPVRLDTRLTVRAVDQGNPTWTLSNKDIDLLQTDKLKNLVTLRDKNKISFETLKKGLLKRRYLSADQYKAMLPTASASADDALIDTTTAFNNAHSASDATAQEAIIDHVKAALTEEGVNAAGDAALLDAVVRLHHHHPQALDKILLYLDPDHTLVYEGRLTADGHGQVKFLYPLNRDIHQYTVSLDVEHRLPKGVESLGAATLVYALNDKQDDAVPSVQIRRNSQQALYLDFAEANATPLSCTPVPVNCLRLNTLFGKQLVAMATHSVERALSWQAQHLPEPPLQPGSVSGTVDFHSANGLYFWELFFHVPFLISWLQRQNREYVHAWRWCTRYLFDPYRTWVPEGRHPPLFWLTRPVRGRAAFAASVAADDPDLLAYADPERYRKALHLFVVENWQRQGDDQYRLLTPDSLVEAALSYDRALRLIGVLPEDLSSAPAQALSVAEAHSGDFAPPLNNKLIELRNLLRNRQFNLRHGLTIDGKPAAIMLDPAVLDQLAQGAVGGAPEQRRSASVARLVPPCHYEEVRKCAGEAVLQLIELGQTQLRFYESEASQKLTLVSKTHIINVLKFPCRLQEQALALAKRERETMLLSQQMAQNKQAYYQGLVDEGITDLETAAMALGGLAQSFYAASIPFYHAAGILDTIPTMFGLAFGNAKPNQGVARVATSFDGMGKIMELVGDDLRLRADYQLRGQQWQHEAEQAAYESKIIDKQLRECDIRIRAASIALEEARAKLKCHEVEYEIMTSVFASHPTYLWLLGRMAEIYSSAYDATLSLCLMAEACLQYELGDFASTWIKTDGWLDNWRGMLAGEALERDLMLMDLAALRDNHRPLDIHADLSLVNDLGWSKERLQAQLAADVIHFELAPQHFDKHFPGHYLRRIERIWLTFNVTKGSTAKSVSAMLYQTSNRVLLTDDLEGAKHLYAGDQGDASAVLRDLRPNQNIAIWSLKEVNRNFDLQPSIPDKSRYQPFEGTGLISSWKIEFPSGAKNNASLFNGDTCTLEDITVHLIYSAVEGSIGLREGVKALLQATADSTTAVPASSANPPPKAGTANPVQVTREPPLNLVSEAADKQTVAAEDAKAAPPHGVSKEDVTTKVSMSHLLDDIHGSDSDAAILVQIDRISKKLAATDDFESKRALLHIQVYAWLWRVHMATQATDASSKEGRARIEAALKLADQPHHDTIALNKIPFSIAGASAVQAITEKINHATTQDRDMQKAIELFSASLKYSNTVAYLKSKLKQHVTFTYNGAGAPPKTAGILSSFDETSMTFRLDNEGRDYYVYAIETEKTPIANLIPDWSRLKL
ncbi:MAG TPA: hypothetical protein DCE25_01505 [Pseudomonas sp.]|nr:hypothetical protein [Pseudomonas sp.]